MLQRTLLYLFIFYPLREKETSVETYASMKGVEHTLLPSLIIKYKLQ